MRIFIFVGTYLQSTMGSLSLAMFFLFLACLLHCHSFKLKLISPESSLSPFYVENISEIQNMNRGLGFEITRARRKSNISAVPVNYSSSQYITPKLKYFQREYVAVIEFGTPEKEYYLIMDTASDVTWIQCKGCDPCFPQARPGPFDPMASKSILLPTENQFCNGPRIHKEDDVCRFSITYADESMAEGLMLLDSIKSDWSSSEEKQTFKYFAFGCGLSNSKFKFDEGNKIAGILGLGFSEVSLLYQTSKSRFSYCLPRSVSTLYTYLTLGDEAAIHGQVQQTPILPRDISGGYVVSLIDISIGNHRLGLPQDLFKESDGGGMFIDTGTTITRMHPFAYKVILRYLRNYFSGLKPYDGRFGKVWVDLCYHKMAHMPEIPPITYHLDGADLVVSGKNSFYVAKEYFCLGMLTEKKDKDTILGSHQQKNIRFLFDIESRQVSFAPEDC